MGRSLSTGRGATAATLALRASRRLLFAPGYTNRKVRTRTGNFGVPPSRFPFSASRYLQETSAAGGLGGNPRIGRNSYLVEVASYATLPILSEIYSRGVSLVPPGLEIVFGEEGMGKFLRLLMSFWLCLIACTSERNNR